jgi:hypothetical protein
VTNKIINVADPSGAADAVNLRSLAEKVTTVLGINGVASAMTVTLSTAQLFGSNLSFWAKAGFSSTGPATLAVTPGGGGATFSVKEIRKYNPSSGLSTAVPLEANDMVIGQPYLFQYDPAANSGVGAYILVNPSRRNVAFRVHKNGSNQITVVGANNNEKITFISEVFDAVNYFNPALSRWTPPAGIVILSLTATVNPNVTSTVLLSIWKNAGASSWSSYANLTNGTATSLSVQVIDFANGTDFYEPYILSTLGDTLVYGAATQTYFSGAVI